MKNMLITIISLFSFCSVLNAQDVSLDSIDIALIDFRYDFLSMKSQDAASFQKTKEKQMLSKGASVSLAVTYSILQLTESKNTNLWEKQERVLQEFNPNQSVHGKIEED